MNNRFNIRVGCENVRNAIFLILLNTISSITLYSQQSMTSSTRPYGVSIGLEKNRLKSGDSSTVVIDGVPIYLWHRGCGPTALGMLIGYYDTHGLSDLFDGDGSFQSNDINEAIASTEHYNNYSLPIDTFPNLKNDKSELGGAHKANSIADFMETSQSKKLNYWGWSWSKMVESSFIEYINMKNSSYRVFGVYEYFSDSTSWGVFTTEIDNNRPVVLLVDSDGDGNTDHFVTGIGYDKKDKTYAIYDTWDKKIHWYYWREISDNYSWGIYGFNVLKFQFKINTKMNPSNGGIVYGESVYDFNQNATITAEATDDYVFLNWTDNGEIVSVYSHYSFSVKKNRELVANFVLESTLNNKSKFVISPNPVTDILRIEIKGKNQEFNFEIINSRGMIIYKANINGRTTIQTSWFVPGIYLLKFENDDVSYVEKIIKK